ncbi:hypothetical protein Pyn_15426 [Prunus yedoensis var. nudiflora]|uniref:Uncharacterized protein n=1 Tax=Prunus yedoensis var. nudiflora TaxID=2094558 RepID=A0A314YR31_PRUYE|nr:hypothetical protein Pyn_15426 [Prunus yedoensis var. nudiflora]
MEIIPPLGDMRYESFLDKSKQDIASSSGLGEPWRRDHTQKRYTQNPHFIGSHAHGNVTFGVDLNAAQSEGKCPIFLLILMA